MLARDRVSLNALAFESTCKLIEAVLARGVNLAEAYIDALGDTTKHKVCVCGGCGDGGRAGGASISGRGVHRRSGVSKLVHKMPMQRVV